MDETGRKQRVGINWQFSQWREVNSRIPERLALWSVIFKLFINYLEPDLSSTVARFADGKLFSMVKPVQRYRRTSLNWVSGQEHGKWSSVRLSVKWYILEQKIPILYIFWWHLNFQSEIERNLGIVVEWLEKLGLFSLEKEQLRVKMIEVYKIMWEGGSVWKELFLFLP